MLFYASLVNQGRFFENGGVIMTKLRDILHGRFVRGERGQGMAEYIIIVILVAIIVLVAVKFFGKSVTNKFENATNEIEELN